MYKKLALALILAAIGLSSCAPDAAENAGITTVAGATDTLGATSGTDGNSPDYVAAPSQTSNATGADPSATRPPDSTPLRLTLSGSVSGSGNYQLHELSQGLLGDGWTVTASALLTQSNLTLALFDHQNNLVQRAVISPGGALLHQLRVPSDGFTLGVTPAAGSGGGSYTLIVERTVGGLVPVVRRQVVWLNFAGGNNVQVHGRGGISFGAFDSARLGSAYAGASQRFKQIILDEMRADYAPYDIAIESSEEGPRPAGTCAVIHFGGDDARLLGLADSVDQYNDNLGEQAIIYTDAFEAFSVMQLTVEQMAQMIANTGSHELGHLLGLFHTKTPDHIMDTTGTAWDLVQDQRFGSAALEPSVFPTGYEDASELLLVTLGANPKPQSAKMLSTAKVLERARIRAIMDEALPTQCGTCLDLDH